MQYNLHLPIITNDKNMKPYLLIREGTLLNIIDKRMRMNRVLKRDLIRITKMETYEEADEALRKLKDIYIEAEKTVGLSEEHRIAACRLIDHYIEQHQNISTTEFNRLFGHNYTVLAFEPKVYHRAPYFNNIDIDVPTFLRDYLSRTSNISPEARTISIVGNDDETTCDIEAQANDVEEPVEVYAEEEPVETHTDDIEELVGTHAEEEPAEVAVSINKLDSEQDVRKCLGLFFLTYLAMFIVSLFTMQLYRF